MKKHQNSHLLNTDTPNNTAINRRNLVKAGAGLAVGAAMAPLIGAGIAQAQTGAQTTEQGQGQVLNGEPKTLILASHPYPQRSRVNKALWEVAQNADNTLFRNLESIYGDDINGFDVAEEHRLYNTMERLVMIFPIHWFNLTPMLKAYMNAVWSAGRPAGLRGKELLVVTTTGAGPEAYQPDGRLGFTIQQVLTPFHASANYTDMIYSEPLAFLGAASADNDTLRGYQQTLADRLRQAPLKA